MKELKQLKEVLWEIKTHYKIWEGDLASVYEEQKKYVEQQLEQTIAQLKAAVQNDLLSADTTNRSAQQAKLLQVLQTATTVLMQVQGIRERMNSDVKKRLESDFTKFTNQLLRYKAVRRRIENELILMRVAVVTAAVKLAAHVRSLKLGMFQSAETQKNIVDEIRTFIRCIRYVDFYDLQPSDVSQIKAAFKKATATYAWGIGNKAKAAMRGQYEEKLDKLLDGGRQLSTELGKLWASCEAEEQNLVGGQYIQKMQKKLGVLASEEHYIQQRGSLRRLLKMLEDNLAEQGDAQAQQGLQSILVKKIPPQIGWLKSAYGLGKCGYENLGDKIGEEVGLPQEAEFEFEQEAPETEASVDILFLAVESPMLALILKPL